MHCALKLRLVLAGLVAAAEEIPSMVCLEFKLLGFLS